MDVIDAKAVGGIGKQAVRCLGEIAAVVGLVLALPLMILIALAVKFRPGWPRL